MSHRYSTAFSYLVVAGTGIYCLQRCSSESMFSYGALIIITVNAVLGVWLWGNPEHGDLVATPYNFTSVVQTVAVLPLITTQIWLKQGMQAELAYVHCLSGALPVVLYLLNHSYGDLVDPIIGLNCLSLGAVSFLKDNHFGIAAAVSYLIQHFYLREGSFTFEDIPVQDVFNYGLCFFCYFTLCALGGA